MKDKIKKKYKILIIIFSLGVVTSLLGVTFSFFRSDANLNSDSLNLAKFIFNSESLDEFQITLLDMLPGETSEYLFSVSNEDAELTSDVTVEYQMILKTYHFIPLIIELYSIDGEERELVINCDESFDRNENNELVCETPTFELEHVNQRKDEYLIKIEFPEEYNSALYADLVDFLDIEIKSAQKIGG